MKNPAAALLLTGALLATACDKNPVDVALDEMLQFEGLFDAGDGMQIELSGDEAIITRLGSTNYSIPMAVGDKYLDAMSRTGPREWAGRGRDDDGLWRQTSVRLTETSLFEGGATWERVGSGGSGEGGGGVPTFDSSDACNNYWNPILKGSWRAKELLRYDPGYTTDLIASGVYKNFTVTWNSDMSYHYKYQVYSQVDFELMYSRDVKDPAYAFEFWPSGHAATETVTSYCRGIMERWFWPYSYDGTTLEARWDSYVLVLVRQ